MFPNLPRFAAQNRDCVRETALGVLERIRTCIGGQAFAALSVAVIVWSGATMAQTGNVASGKSTYTSWCILCHNANPLVDAHGIINGADNPNFILNTWRSDPNMQFLLLGALPNPAQTAADVAAYLGSLLGGATNYEGLWWKSPAGAESGWGINLAHQGDTIFASWFTYDLSGKAWWLVMTAPKTGPDTYAGTLYQTTGPPFSATPFNPAQVGAVQVGTATLSFSDANNGSFSYTVNGISQNKAITRQVFGPVPSCGTATSSLEAASNYQDIWWTAPAGSESGWGINFTHQGDTIFASWFTYDVDRSPMWLVVTAPKSAPGAYTGTLYRTTGPAFNAAPFNPGAVAATAVGTATFSFSDGNNATFAYTVNGIAQAKSITREVFEGAGTVCR